MSVGGLIVKVFFVRTMAVTASLLFAGLAGLWFAIKIHQSFSVDAPLWAQTFMVTVAVLLFAPFLALIFLSLKPGILFKEETWRGSIAVASIAFVWFCCALFLSMFAGFGGF
ncbi:hypothetical protein [Arthrobacter zhaoguopingii]|uniref:hypothetical protein n=1 Tax=Arthrobacter zhaoguopingii TaxID=2681491 RepID=UPI00135AA0E6|nr:hypothetical protein [Arthrobacter zhaoguopingii]